MSTFSEFLEQPASELLGGSSNIIKNVAIVGVSDPSLSHKNITEK